MEKCHKPHRPAVVRPWCNLDPRTPAATKPLKTNSWNGPGSLQAMIGLGLAVLAALLAAPEGRAQTPNPNPPPAATPPPSAKALHDWRKGMARVPPPKKGCFTSSYPSTEWQEVPCTTAPARPYPPARGGGPGRPDRQWHRRLGPGDGPHIRGHRVVRQRDRRDEREWKRRRKPATETRHLLAPDQRKLLRHLGLQWRRKSIGVQGLAAVRVLQRVRSRQRGRLQPGRIHAILADQLQHNVPSELVHLYHQQRKRLLQKRQQRSARSSPDDREPGQPEPYGPSQFGRHGYHHHGDGEQSLLGAE
jgi:hypothetical protein